MGLGLLSSSCEPLAYIRLSSSGNGSSVNRVCRTCMESKYAGLVGCIGHAGLAG